jgi:hypothetical protein
MSESYGGCEAGELPTDADILEENGTAANLLGITYMAAAGDDGAADCVEEGLSGLYVDMPGSFPGVTSVGGTQFPSPAWDTNGNLDSYPSIEAVWNESNDPYQVYEYMGMTYSAGVGAGGGGISSIFLRPAYQSALSACSPVGSLPTPPTAPMRQVPDVALSAASGTPGYYIECTFDDTTGDCSATGGMAQGTPIGGTSASSPSFTGFVAILNQAVGERLGNINPILYQLEAAAPTAPPFHDLTVGNNEVVCGPGGEGDAGPTAYPDGGVFPDAGCADGGLYGFLAVPGYDCATGIGSIDGFNLVSAWLGAVKTDTVLVPTPTSTSEGKDVTLTATVNVDGANTNALTGNVTFAFESYNARGGIDLSWELGAVAIVAGTTAGGQAVLTTTVPPGLVNPAGETVDVVAFYGGDANHLASTSAKVSLTFAPITFAVDPAALLLQPFGKQTFTSTGGVPPVRWFIEVDTTVEETATSFGASFIDETAGIFVAGPMAGYVEVVALDSFGAEAISEITVGAPTLAPPWEADAGVDSGTPDSGIRDAGQGVANVHDGGLPVVDAGRAVRDAAVAHATHDDASDAGDAMEPASSGCSCELAKGRTPAGSAPFGAIGTLVFGLTVAVRRRRSRR